MRIHRPHTTRTHTTRRHAIRAACVAGLVASSLAIISSPASADGDRDDRSERVVVGEGESIQAAIDAADPGTKIVVRGDHVENLWIQTDGIELIGKNATLTMPEVPTGPTPCTNFGQPSTLICVSPPVAPPGPNPEDPPPPPPALDEYLDEIEISGFTLHNPLFDAVGVFFTNDIEIEKNTIVNPGCDGIFAIFTTDFEISRNVVTDAQCSGINVAASSSGEISRNTTTDSAQNGISLGDTSHVEIERNTASGSCIGIAASDGADGGYGIREEDFPGRDVTITRNTTNGNNRTCPFGPFSIGVTGIGVAGLTDVTISRNTANDNVSTEESVTAGGIWVGDFPNQFGPPTQSNGVTVTRNTARGNSSAAGPADLSINPVLGTLTVDRNRCDVSIPDASWCS